MRRKRAIFFFILGLLFAFALGLRIFNANRFHLEKRTVFLMDTFVSVCAVGPKSQTLEPLRLALERMRQINEKFNAFNPKGQIYAFNHLGAPITDAEILGVISIALKVSELSDGAFDITTFPLSELWGFASKKPKVPSEEAIQETLKDIGWRHLILQPDKLVKDRPGVRIGLGGIAKGYAVSEAVKVLKEQGINNALIDAGGHVYALGQRGARPWRIGIKDPRSDGILGYVDIKDLAVLGSGDYERFFIENGKRYSHIFDPKTGYPVQGVQAVTVLYRDPVLADAFTKVPFVLGVAKGNAILASVPGLESIIVTEKGEIYYSAGLNGILKVNNLSE